MSTRQHTGYRISAPGFDRRAKTRRLWRNGGGTAAAKAVKDMRTQRYGGSAVRLRTLTGVPTVIPHASGNSNIHCAARKPAREHVHAVDGSWRTRGVCVWLAHPVTATSAEQLTTSRPCDHHQREPCVGVTQHSMGPTLRWRDATFDGTHKPANGDTVMHIRGVPMECECQLTNACIDEETDASLDEGFLPEAEISNGLQQLLPEAGLRIGVGLPWPLCHSWSRVGREHPPSATLMPPPQSG